MRINFRQGLISFQKENGSPAYLHPSNTNGFVSLVVAQTPTLAAFAHGASDYLLQFDRSVDLAWGPMIPNQTNYLFWDIDLLTADVTYGITTLAPIVSLLEPTQLDGQHWFDLNTMTMKVWSTSRNKWQTKVRVFAGHVTNGNTNQLVYMAQGTQIQLNVPSNPGFIVRDFLLKPIRQSNGEFLTEDAPVHVDTTVGTSGVLVQPTNRLVPVRAGEAIPAMSFVYFSDDDTVRLASSNPALSPMLIPVGMILDDLTVGDIGHLAPVGEVSYDQWSWEGHAGEPLYIDTNGQLTLNRPGGLLAYRVAFIKNANTILIGIDAETFPQVYTADTNSMIISGVSPVSVTSSTNGLGERTVSISVPLAGSTAGLMTPQQVSQIAGFDSRITSNTTNIATLQSSKANTVHTHVIADVTGLQAVLNSKSDVTHNHDLVYSQLCHTHSQYTPFGHVHTVVDVTGLQDALNSKANRVHLNSFDEVYTTVNRTDTYDVGSGTTLVAALAGKTDVGHLHQIVDVQGLQNALNGKTNVGHQHQIADVAGLQTELDNRAFVSHTHTISNVTGLQTALDGKASVVHTHVAADVTDFKAAVAAQIVAGDNITIDVDATTKVVTISGSAGSTGPSKVTNNIAASAYTLSEADFAAETILRMTSADATTITIPSDGDISVGSGQIVVIGACGDGTVSLAPAAGVTLNSPETYTINKKFGKIALMKVGANEWDVEGNLLPGSPPDNGPVPFAAPFNTGEDSYDYTLPYTVDDKSSRVFLMNCTNNLQETMYNVTYRIDDAYMNADFDIDHTNLPTTLAPGQTATLAVIPKFSAPGQSGSMYLAIFAQNDPNRTSGADYEVLLSLSGNTH